MTNRSDDRENKLICVSLKELHNSYELMIEYKNFVFNHIKTNELYIVRDWANDDEIYIEKAGFYDDDLEIKLPEFID